MKNLISALFKTFVKEIKNILFALLLAIIVWFAISMQLYPDIVTHINDIAVTLQPTDYMIKNNLNISEDFEHNVSVQISGKRYDIGNLSNEDFTASLDLSEVTGPGEYTVGIKVTTVDKGVECEIDDSALTCKIRVQKTISKTFSVAEGNLYVTADDVVPTADMKIDSITVQPSVITLTGNSDELEAIKTVEIRSVFAGEASATLSSKGQVVFLGAAGEEVNNPDISLDNENFTVNVTLLKQKTLPLTVRFTNVPKNFDISSLKYNIYPETLTVSSPDDSLDALEKFEVGAIDLSQLTTRYLQKLSLPVTLPEGYKNVSGNNTALISFEGAEDYTFLSFAVQKDNIRIINAPDDFDIEVLTNELNVNVTGPAQEIAEMTSKDIYATIDLMGTTLTEGYRDFAPVFTLRGSKVKSWVTGEYKVSLKLSEKTETPEDIAEIS